MSSILNQILGRNRMPTITAGPMVEADAPPPAVPATPPAPPASEPPAGAAMSHADWMAKCQAVLPQGAEMHEACCYGLNGKTYMQMCHVDGDTIVLDGAPIEVPMPTTEPAAVPGEEPPMEPSSKAPDFLISAFGVTAGSTLADIIAAGGGLKAAAAKADLEAKTAAVDASGVKPAARSRVLSEATRTDGQTWPSAIAAYRTANDYMFEASSPGPKTDAGDVAGTTGHAPPQPPAPKGAGAGRNEANPDTGAQGGKRRSRDVAAGSMN